MRQRFTVDELGRLVDRDGNVLGKLVSLTLESPRAAGTIGVAVSSGEQQGLEGEQTPLAPSEPSMQDPIDVVWAHYVEVMKPRKRELDAQGRAVIREALKVATVEECCGAIDGCKASSFHMDARTFPGDGLVVSRGEEAARWLRAEIGIEWDAAARRWRDVPRQGA
jgi:hypothetical protein